MYRIISRVLFIIVLGCTFFPATSFAVPAFARQTGMDCAACHTSFPELTPFGRDFKLNGYTLGERQLLPLAAMMQFSMTHVDTKSNANGTYIMRQNDPTFDYLGLFLAGKITDNAGAFIQATYNNVNANAEGGINHHSHADNTDIRVIGSNQLFGKDIVYGLDVNNNPTVQDVWNSTPAWGFPFTGSSLTGIGGTAGSVGGGYSTQIEGGLAQKVAGVGGYFWWDRHLYGELSFYGTADNLFRPMSLGDWYNNSSNFALQSRDNPYWRLAWSQDWDSSSLMVGTYGMRVNVYPDATNRTGPTDRYTDTALDAQYQYITDPHIITAQATYIHEKQDLNATYAGGAGTSSNPTDTLNTFRAKVSYLYDRKYGGTLWYFQNTGSADAGLYNPNATNVSNKPDTRGYIAELDYNPMTQVRISLQYIGYTKINGANGNYDGTGRKASDNNTLFLYSWFAF
jgi:hypothetical protein